MENLMYIIGPLILAALFGISFAFWNWYSKRQNEEEFQLPAEEGEALDTSTFDKLLSGGKKSDILSGTTDKYDWMQNDKEIEVYVRVDSSVKGKEVKCIIEAHKLVVAVRGKAILDGEFYAPVLPEECNWQIGESLF
jgi:hypothetical protein